MVYNSINRLGDQTNDYQCVPILGLYSCKYYDQALYQCI
jgi:hypothetical protein